MSEAVDPKRNRDALNEHRGGLGQEIKPKGRPMHTPRRRRAIFISSALLISFVLSFFCLELLCFVFEDQIFAQSMYVYDRTIGYRVRAGHDWFGHPTNRFGFNDQDHQVEKPEDVYRIVMLGDSFAWMGGYEPNYVYRIEKHLENGLGGNLSNHYKRIEVINASYPGLNTAQERDLLEEIALQYEPDLVLLGFFAGNDIFDATPGWRVMSIGGVLTPVYEGDGGIRHLFGRPLLRKSRLVLGLQQWRARRRVRPPEAPPQSPTPSGRTLPNGFDNRSTEYSLAEWYREHNHEIITQLDRHKMSLFESRYLQVAQELKAIDQLLAAKDVPWKIIAFPAEYQVNPYLLTEAAKTHGQTPGDYDLDAPQAWLAEQAQALGVEYWDLLPAFQAAHVAEGGLYIPNDSHWNRAGNELAAEIIAQKLVRSGLGQEK